MFESMRRGLKGSDSVIAGLDIGSSKVCCAIARVGPGNELNVIGIGYHASRGIRAGTIIDMESLQTAVAHAVHQAEEMADVTLEEVFVTVSPSICASKTVKVELPISGHAVDENDIKKIVQQAVQSLHSSSHVVIHTIPITYEIDEIAGIRDPRGMFGELLKAKIHMLFANKTPLRNLTACVERAHLDVTNFVTSIYASGLATLVEDELDLGVTLIDMGAGTSSVGIFYNGKLAQIDHVSLGGAHVTSDIARCLSTPLINAERIKTLYGTTMVSPSDSREMIPVPQIGEDETSKGSQIAKYELTQIIRPRVEEIFETIKQKLIQHPAYKMAGRRLVLTGGASLLPGMTEIAGLVLDKQTRLGKPLYLKGTTEGTRSPAFASCAGLLIYGQRQKSPYAMLTRKKEAPANSFGRIGMWLKENF
jgi:cell division protein FtsA